ncbi:acyl-CoA thioester hydrolase/BAAT C-terminal domain-containing protein [Achromobacter xylosoxidans]
MALSGISRGGETSLLVASHYPDLVSAVVAYVPSPVTHGVVSAGEPGTGRNAQVWRKGGSPCRTCGRTTPAPIGRRPTPRTRRTGRPMRS